MLYKFFCDYTLYSSSTVLLSIRVPVVPCSAVPFHSRSICPCRSTMFVKFSVSCSFFVVDVLQAYVVKDLIISHQGLWSLESCDTYTAFIGVTCVT
jgi:hypothetical protein